MDRTSVLTCMLAHGPYKDWHKIASALPGRNNKDCRKRWHYRGNGVIRKGPWKLDEDHRLWTGVQKHGNRSGQNFLITGTSANGE
jgi:hypothetical protein